MLCPEFCEVSLPTETFAILCSTADANFTGHTHTESSHSVYGQRLRRNTGGGEGEIPGRKNPLQVPSNRPSAHGSLLCWSPNSTSSGSEICLV